MQIGGFASLAILFVLVTTQTPPNQTPDAERQARQASDDEVRAFLKNDRLAMEHLWADEFVVTNPLNKFATKKEVLSMVQSGFLVITSYQRRVEYAHVYRDTVILAGSETVTWGGKMPAAGKAEELRFTAVWMKRDGRWREVVRHANIIPRS